MNPKRKPAGKASQIAELTEAVRELNSNFSKLSDRLFGDPDRQLKGLTQEVQELSSATERGLKEAADAISKINANMQALETFRTAQEETNKKFAAICEQAEVLKNQAIGGWKLITLVWTLGTTFSGLIVWVITKYAGH